MTAQETNRERSKLRSDFVSLYTRHGSAMLAYFRRRLPAVDADDAVADVFEIAWRRFETVPTDDDAALSWLYGVARNVLHNRVRSRSRRRRLGVKVAGQAPERAPGVELQVVRRFRDQVVIDAVLSLPDKYRETLVLAEWDGLPREEIAAIFGVSRAAIDQRISRAYKRLARSIDLAALDEARSTSPLEPERGGRS